MKKLCFILAIIILSSFGANDWAHSATHTYTFSGVIESSYLDVPIEGLAKGVDFNGVVVFEDQPFPSQRIEKIVDYRVTFGGLHTISLENFGYFDPDPWINLYFPPSHLQVQVHDPTLSGDFLGQPPLYMGINIDNYNSQYSIRLCLGSWGSYISGIITGGTALQFPLIVNAPNISLDFLSYDFGKVEPGAPSSVYVNIANIGGSVLTVDDIYFQYVIDGGPFTVEAPPLPIEIAAGDSVDIPVSYNPSFLYLAQNNNLVIVSNDDDEPSVEISFTGTGTVSSGTPSQSIVVVQQFIDFAFETGTLYFSGEGDSGQAHYDAIEDMLTSASTANNVCGALQAIYKRIDGDPKQKDWLEGPAVDGVAAAILNIMDEMDCK